VTYAPNVPALSVTGELVVEDIRAVLLAEFASDVGVREILMDPASAVAPEAPDALPQPPLAKSAISEAIGEALQPSEQEAETADSMLHEPFPTRPVAAASGVRLHRVIGPDHKVVTQFDAEKDMTPLDFLGEDGAVVAVTHPGDVYSWKLIKLGPANGNVAAILAMRIASDEESKALDEMYPGWLEACKKFDAQNAAAKDFDPGLPPPVLPQ
jgi:hypothetical protein